MVSGAIEYLATSTIFSSLGKVHGRNTSLLLMYGSYTITVLGILFYPLFGFLADICCGRYWTVTASAITMTAGILVAAIASPLHVAYSPEGDEDATNRLHPLSITLISVAYALGILGVAAFEANVVQFGLDQLMEESSRRLSLFLHALIWLRQLGEMLSIFPLSLRKCDRTEFHQLERISGSFQFIPLAVFVLTFAPLVALVWKRNRFYRELGSINPYKMVVKVLGFALKNRHPQRRRSAFFYYYGLNPGRLDFAKVHYGGPYETEDVENVKTLLQILRLFVCIGPVFILKVAASYFMYQHFVRHFVKEEVMENSCHTFWPLVGSGNLKNMITVLFYPVYILVLFRVLKRIPKILLRLFVGVVMMTLALASVLLMEVGGHARYSHNGGGGGGGGDRVIQCALVMSNQTENRLDMPWGLLIIPNLLHGIASPIVYTTIFEFISAQSPKSMTGLLIGTFFFTRGLFQLVGIVIVIPFSLGKLWHTPQAKDELTTLNFYTSNTTTATTTTAQTQLPHVSVACEMWYLVVVVFFGILGICLFSVAAWKYKYREREERPFPQSDIEDIVTRDIEQDTQNLHSETQNLLDIASVETGETAGRRMVYSNT